ncbi:hypothetical protein KP509_31G052300 [Ceratopteris richardii]|uniref:Uncharacterized protein n=1 Tax=Ceratopteris richardii TaxID=49495 RepID=A0A8T2QZA7_CERRI|nr:hypothetical protein KP509_31G052300 [Ceratopteris richardii]
MEACGGGSSSSKCSGSGKPMCLCAPTTHAGSFRCRLHRSSSFGKSDRHSSNTSSGSSFAASSTNGSQ